MKTKFWLILLLSVSFGGCLLANHFNLFKLSNIASYQPKIYAKKHIDSLKKFALENNCNSHLGIFINFKHHSGSKRFCLVNLDSQTCILDGLVCHGKGKFVYSETAKFSNEIGSNCSSEGFYKIGGKYEGKFGTSYKLHGLNSSNSMAFKRFVVLHAHECVPISPVPVTICQSEGCPTLAPEVLKKLEPYLDQSKKPVLLWIYR